MFEQVISESVLSTTLIAVKIVVAYIALIWLALVFWTWRDISRRSSDHVVQGLSVLLTLGFFLPGYWLYLLLRPRTTLSERSEEQLRRSILSEYSSNALCPKCHKITREEYVVCPHCLTELRPSCTRCAHAIAVSWNACPYCGQVAARSPLVDLQETPVGVQVVGAQPVSA